MSRYVAFSCINEVQHFLVSMKSVQTAVSGPYSIPVDQHSCYRFSPQKDIFFKLEYIMIPRIYPVVLTFSSAIVTNILDFLDRVLQHVPVKNKHSIWGMYPLLVMLLAKVALYLGILIIQEHLFYTALSLPEQTENISTLKMFLVQLYIHPKVGIPSSRWDLARAYLWGGI